MYYLVLHTFVSQRPCCCIKYEIICYLNYNEIKILFRKILSRLTREAYTQMMFIILQKKV